MEKGKEGGRGGGGGGAECKAKARPNDNSGWFHSPAPCAQPPTR